jgi:thiol-disulfide isomerase/thioredoxin
MFKKIALFALVLALLGGVYMWYIYNVPKYIVGTKAPDFEAKIIDGSTKRLSDLKGNYVILQFWGSWCGPCRRENPELVKIYKHFGGQGLEIFSVAIEQKTAPWESAIMKDSMIWPYHTVELEYFKGPIAKLYGVLQIPSVWLIDPSGMIIGNNMLPSKIEELLVSKLN